MRCLQSFGWFIGTIRQVPFNALWLRTFSFIYFLIYPWFITSFYFASCVCLMAHFLFHTYLSKTYITLYYLLFSTRNCLHLLPIIWFESSALASKPLVLAKRSVKCCKLLQNITLIWKLLSIVFSSYILLPTSLLTFIFIPILSLYLQISELIRAASYALHSFVSLCVSSS